MKKIFILLLCAGVVFLTAGCQNAQTRATEGAVIGGVLGAAAGGIIGHQSHHAGEGAGIGAAAGAVTGAIVGAQIEKNPQSLSPGASVTQATQLTQSPNPNQMSIPQIVDLTKQNINENVIIDKIRLTNSKFMLSSGDIDYLKQQGVSQKVIDAMQGK